MTSIFSSDKGPNIVQPVDSSCKDETDNLGMATAGGVFNGIAGLIGLGGFWDPIKQSNLTSATNDLTNQQTKVRNVITQDQQAIKKLENNYIQDQFKQIEAIEKFHQELEDDKIQIDTLLIQIICGILLIIIIYLIFL
jgi:hypothetical protein